MTVEITRGDIAALPSSDRAAELLPLTDGDTLTLSCTDSDMWFAAEKPKHED